MPLTQRQISIVGECLRAAAYGPFFPDGEFESIFGLSRSQVAAVADEWPIVLDEKHKTEAAIQNSMNNLIGYPIKAENMEHWDEFISTDRKELRAVFDAWRITR